MTLQSYFGLEREDGNSWVLVQWLEGNVILLQRFRDKYLSIINSVFSAQVFEDVLQRGTKSVEALVCGPG